MSTRQLDPVLLYKQLEHLEKEIQIIKWELAQIAPTSEDAQIAEPEIDTTWDALQDVKGLWEREWDAEWETVWEKR